MLEFKNRFRMFKTPLDVEDFESIFEHLHVGGISFEGETNSQPVQRTFCSCGFNDAAAHDKCPKCGKQIVYAHKSWGSTGASHKASFYDLIELPGGNFSVKRIDIMLGATSCVKEFKAISSASELGVITKSPDGPIFERSPVFSAGSNKWTGKNSSEDFAKEAHAVLLKMYDDCGIVINKLNTFLASLCASRTCALVNAMHYLPLVFNDDNYAKFPNTINGLLQTEWIADMCEQVPVCKYPPTHRYYWVGGGKKPSKVLTLDEAVWLSGVIPEFGDTEKYFRESYWRSIDWASATAEEFQERAEQRDFIKKTSLGQYLAHRYCTGNMSAEGIEEWAEEYKKWFKTPDSDTFDLFLSWYKERVDIVSNRISSVVPAFNQQLETLSSLGYYPDEDSMRQRKFNSIINQAKYNLSEYVDIDAGMKNPMQLIIDMGKKAVMPE